jgi:hypothetical protein
MIKIKELVYCVLVIILLGNCNIQKNNEHSELIKQEYIGGCKKFEYIPVSIDDLINNPAEYNNKHISVAGNYISGTEIHVISREKKFSKENNIWMDFLNSNDLRDISDTSLKFYSTDPTLKNNRLRVFGLFDTSLHGHLNMFPGGIRSICNIKIIEQK